MEDLKVDSFISYSSAHWVAHLGGHRLPPDQGDPALPTEVARAREVNGNFDYEVATLGHYDDGVAFGGGDA